MGAILDGLVVSIFFIGHLILLANLDLNIIKFSLPPFQILIWRGLYQDIRIGCKLIVSHIESKLLRPAHLPLVGPELHDFADHHFQPANFGHVYFTKEINDFNHIQPTELHRAVVGSKRTHPDLPINKLIRTDESTIEESNTVRQSDPAWDRTYVISLGLC